VFLAMFVAALLLIAYVLPTRALPSAPAGAMLAEKAGVSAQPVTAFELLGADSRISTLHKMHRALETAGLRFIDEDEEGGPAYACRSARQRRRGSDCST
jgi:hypothetical protein